MRIPLGRAGAHFSQIYNAPIIRKRYLYIQTPIAFRFYFGAGEGEDGFYIQFRWPVYRYESKEFWT